MERYTILIYRRECDQEVEASPNTPALLEDKIKKVVKEYFKDDTANAR